ncbi:hypothetical protein TNCV_3426501 [Trichonephila clavipes]|nr:hypothetical protein TNCV_3426501 [Trichonephila clavipes]
MGRLVRHATGHVHVANFSNARWSERELEKHRFATPSIQNLREIYGILKLLNCCIFGAIEVVMIKRYFVFQQDGAPPHWHIKVRDCLNQACPTHGPFGDFLRPN